MENLVSMQKGSVCVEESEDRKSVGTSKKGSSKRDLYSLGFTYDSLVPAVVRIFVGASDRTVPHQIRCPPPIFCSTCMFSVPASQPNISLSRLIDITI